MGIYVYVYVYLYLYIIERMFVKPNVYLKSHRGGRFLSAIYIYIYIPWKAEVDKKVLAREVTLDTSH